MDFDLENHEHLCEELIDHLVYEIELEVKRIAYKILAKQVEAYDEAEKLCTFMEDHYHYFNLDHRRIIAVQARIIQSAIRFVAPDKTIFD